MLSIQEIIDLNLMLIEDIEELNLANNEIPEKVNYYLENISGLELLSETDLHNHINQILNKANFPSI